MRTRRLGLVLVPLLMVGSGCGDDDDKPRPTPTATATSSVTRTPSATATEPAPPTSTASPSATATATLAPTGTPTGTAQATATATSTPLPGAPQIVLFGVARADDLVQEPDGFDAEGRAIFPRITGQGLTLFVEARRGRARLNNQAYDPDSNLPGIEVIASRPLGDGSLTVCDYDPPLIGGVPAVNPPVFSDDAMVTDAIADLGCRFNDGTGQPAGRVNNNACTRDAGSLYQFVNDETELQYCLPIARSWAFPPGDTIVAARVRDTAGNVSAPVEIVVRVQGEVPFDCEDGLGERVFAPQRQDSHLWTRVAPSQVSNPDALVDLSVLAPLRICAGPDLGGGVHQLTLREDALVGLLLSDGSVMCTRFAARGSDGVIDCDGGTAHDVLASQLADAAAPIVVDGGLGLPAGTGAASLRMPVSVRLLPLGATPGDCAEASFGLEFSDVLTTTLATAQVVNGLDEVLVAESREGAPFVCSFWRDGDQGQLVLPLPAAASAAGDVAAVLQLKE